MDMRDDQIKLGPLRISRVYVVLSLAYIALAVLLWIAA